MPGSSSGSGRSIGVAMLGYAFMGHAHSLALASLPAVTWPAPLEPRLVSVSGRDQTAVAAARDRFGWEEAVSDWRLQVDDGRVELFDNAGPNHLHAEPTIEAVRRGKHVLCEKPLGRTAEEAFAIWGAAASAGAVHMCGFNYRFVPAIRLAREMLEAGDLGEVYHFRSRFLNRSAIVREAHGAGEWRFHRETSGSGAVGDIGSHHIDLARYLVGEPVAVSAITQTIERGSDSDVDIDDAFSASLEFETGTTGTIECSRVAGGHQNQNAIEVEGSRGALGFDVQDINTLEVSDGRRTSRISVTEPDHPFMRFWWPTPHPIGWGATFIHQFHHLLSAIGDGTSIPPHGASFEDGYRCAEVCDAILRSAARGTRESLEYRILSRARRDPC